jgi:hypothetical protein
MRSVIECLAKAAELERLADDCAAPEARADYRRIAKGWRGVAQKAEWQDKALRAPRLEVLPSPPR